MAVSYGFTTPVTRRSFCRGAALAGGAALLAACGAQSTAPGSAAQSGAAAGQQPVTLVVFAAASLTETLTALGGIYSAAHPQVQFAFNFDSSGTLRIQIQEGAECDLFLSAGQPQMDALDPSVTAGAAGIDPATRTDLLENKVVLCVPPGGGSGIDSFDTLAQRLQAGDILFCMGNGDVPVGQYTQRILQYYGLDEQALAAAGAISYGSNVKEVTTQVAEASVDAGVVYATDAASAGLVPVDEADAAMCGRIVYPAAVTQNAAHPQQAQAFLAWLCGDEAMEQFAGVGFARPTAGGA